MYISKSYLKGNMSLKQVRSLVMLDSSQRMLMKEGSTFLQWSSKCNLNIETQVKARWSKSMQIVQSFGKLLTYQIVKFTQDHFRLQSKRIKS
jgi:hypothetical protein